MLANSRQFTGFLESEVVFLECKVPVLAKPTQLAGQSQKEDRPANRRRTTTVPTLPAPGVY